MGYDERFELSDGRLVWYLDEGPDDGVPVLFCHGSPSSRLAAVDHVSRAVERGGRLIAPDRPGLGRSDPEPGRSLASWAQDVAELMNRLGLARFRVLAVSGGGPYALALAWALPDRVERVALLSSPGSFDIPGAMDGMARAHRLTWRLARWSPRTLGWLLGRQAAALARDAARFEHAIVVSMHGADREALEALGTDERRRFMTAPLVEAMARGTKGAVEDLRALRAPWGFGVQSIEVPVHLWHGEADDATPRQMGGWLAAMIPGAEMRFLPREGHTSTVLRYADEAFDVLLGDSHGPLNGSVDGHGFREGPRRAPASRRWSGGDRGSPPWARSVAWPARSRADGRASSPRQRPVSAVARLAAIKDA